MVTSIRNFKPLTHATLCTCAHVSSSENQKHFIPTAAIPMATQQISNSLGEKLSHWDSQNETFITHYEKKKKENTLNLSYVEKIMSFWEYI